MKVFRDFFRDEISLSNRAYHKEVRKCLCDKYFIKQFLKAATHRSVKQISFFTQTHIYEDRYESFSARFLTKITVTQSCRRKRVSYLEFVAVSDAPLSQQVLTFTGSKRKCHRFGMRDLGSPILNFAFYLFHTLLVAVLEKVKFILWFTGVRYGGRGV